MTQPELLDEQETYMNLASLYLFVPSVEHYILLSFMARNSPRIAHQWVYLIDISPMLSCSDLMQLNSPSH